MGSLLFSLKLILYCLPVFILIDKGRVMYALVGFLIIASPVILTLYGVLSMNSDNLTYSILQVIAWFAVGFMALRLRKMAS